MAFSKKLCLVQDMKDNLYCNMVAEVVKVFDSHTGVDLYVTDYTKHRDLFLYTDPNDPDTMGYSSSSNWPGPSGQFTIMIHLWDNQADAAREKGIKVGDIVVLQNVHIEYNMDRMEGGIHTDRDWRDKICIRICTDKSQLYDQEQRKAKYEQEHKPQKERRERQTTNNLPDNVPKTVPHNAPGKAQKTKSAKSHAKKKERREKERLQKELEQDELEKQFNDGETNLQGLNENIRAGNKDYSLSTVAEIYGNPSRATMIKGIRVPLKFTNCNYRAHLRVVDMWPANLENWAQSMGDIEFNTEATPEQLEESHNEWQWNFVLLVEDAVVPAKTDNDRLQLVFDNARGQCLLRMDACNLRQNPKELEKLRDKLIHLWGNLHERKKALKKEGIKLPLPSDDPKLRLQSLSFEACIQEYGEEVMGDDGKVDYVQHFSTHNTTIMG